MSHSNARIAVAAVRLRKHMLAHRDQTRADLEAVVAPQRVPLEKVLAYLADRGEGSLSVKDINGVYRRNPITRDRDVRQRRIQSLERLFGDLVRQSRASRGLADRHPGNKRIQAEADANDAESIRVGTQLGIPVREIVVMLTPVA